MEKHRTKNLYVLTSQLKLGYDSYDSCVVVAEDAESASKIHPSSFANDDEWWIPNSKLRRQFSDWPQPEHVTVEWIGAADPALKVGTVICASFNSG